MPLTIEDPHFLPGQISGETMEHTPDGRIVHTKNAIMLDAIDVCLVGHPAPGNPMFAMALAGTISAGADRAQCLFLFSPDGAGVIIDRIVSMAGILGPEYVQRLLSRVRPLSPVEPTPDPELEPTTPAEEPQESAPDADKKVA